MRGKTYIYKTVKNTEKERERVESKSKDSTKKYNCNGRECGKNLIAAIAAIIAYRGVLNVPTIETVR